MSNERLAKVLAAVGLSEKGIDAREENTIIVEAARKAKATHLVGGADASQTFVEVKQWLSLSIVLVEEDLEKIDQGLFSKSYLVGNSFTVADAAVFVAVSLSNFKASVLKFSELRRWYVDISFPPKDHCFVIIIAILYLDHL
jgi:glutathione S-transferase